ncbi:NAD(P)-binding protein [Auriscalpium vulgare]|uniref:NAD(P)-binding protein n=1 Tax=Auriscalpium vulgare TaxID=40419 RepID=A0ACB8RAA9_9AGAM|nr:NAD(P)-binding protein [Auriscalpium vulgare]
MGNWWSVLAQAFPPKPTWGIDNIPDLTGKVLIVTGAGNAGIGKETVKALLLHNAKVYIAARSEERALASISALKEDTGKEAIFLKLDLADLPQVRAAAEEFLSKEKELHILFLNAGVMACPVDWTTAQGYDMQFGTNRETFPLYFSSKLGNMTVARELARRYGDNIVSTSVHPGTLKTDLARHISWLQRLMFAILVYDVPFGALTQLRAGTAPEGADWNGKFLIPWARIGKANPKAEDPAVGEKLWLLLEEYVKEY